MCDYQRDYVVHKKSKQFSVDSGFIFYMTPFFLPVTQNYNMILNIKALLSGVKTSLWVPLSYLLQKSNKDSVR